MSWKVLSVTTRREGFAANLTQKMLCFKVKKKFILLNPIFMIILIFEVRISREKPVHGVGLWSAFHKREFLSFVEWGNSTKGNFKVSWSYPTPWKVISEFHGVHSMKGIFLFLWSDPTLQKGIFGFRGVSLLHKREFLIFVEWPYSMKENCWLSWSALHEREFLIFME